MKDFKRSKSDFIVVAYPAGGPGGQHANKTSTAIRITDKETGLSACSTEHKSQMQNKKAAFRRLVSKLIDYYSKSDEEIRKLTSEFGGGGKVVRTYNSVNNYVKDETTGARYEYSQTVGKGDMGKMIEERWLSIDLEDIK